MAKEHSKRSTEDPTSVEYFDGLAADWLSRYRDKSSFHTRLTAVNRVLSEEFRSGSPRAIVDYGSGPGLFAVLASAYAPFVVCVDTSLEMLRAGAAKEGRRQIDQIIGPVKTSQTWGKVHYVAGSSSCLSRTPRFDLVLAIAVLEYVPDVLQTLSDLAEATLPGGHLICTVPRAQSKLRWLERSAAVLAPHLDRFHWQRVIDSAYRSYRPDGDAVPWLPASETVGWALRDRQPLPLADQGPLARVVPNEFLLFDRVPKAR